MSSEGVVDHDAPSGDAERRQNRVPRHLLVSAYACAPGSGSEAAIAWQWVRHLSARCRVSVVTRTRNRAPIEAWVAKNPLPNLCFYYIDSLRGFRSWTMGKLEYARWQRRVLRTAGVILREDPYDLIHHVTVASINYPIFLQELPVPLVYGPIGGGEVVPSSFRREGTAQARVYEWTRAVRQRTLHFDRHLQKTLEGAARILVANQETAALIPCRFRPKTSILPSVGIERELVVKPTGQRCVHCRIYTAGRLLPWKGFHLALEAFARVAKHHPGLTFTIVGDGPERRRLEQLAATLGVGGRVSITGWLPRDEVFQISQDSDVFLFPSLRDAGGMVVLEAMAAGIPVICLDTAGPGALVGPECGIKVPVTTPEQVVADLAGGLDRLIGDEATRRQMGMAAQQRVLDEFLWDKKVERMLAIFQATMAPADLPR